MTNCGPNTTSAHCASWPVGPGEKLPMRSLFVWHRDVAETFSDSDAVNEALRLLIRIAKGQIDTRNRLRPARVAEQIQ